MNKTLVSLLAGVMAVVLLLGLVAMVVPYL